MNNLNDKVFLIIKEIAGVQSNKFNHDSNLFDESILDSFGLIQLVGEIDGQFEIAIRTEDLTTQNFASVNNIANLITKYQTEK